MCQGEIPKIDDIHAYEHSETIQMPLRYLDIPDKNLVW